MADLSELLSNGGGLGAADFQGMTPEQIQAVAGNTQKNHQLVNSLVMALAENKLKNKSINESVRHNKQVEGITEMKNKNDFTLGQDLNTIRQKELAIKEKANKHKTELENSLLDTKKQLLAAQANHLDSEAKSLQKQAEIYDYKIKGIQSLADTKVSIGDQDFNGITIATNPQIAQAWAASIPEKGKADRKAASQAALIASGVDPKIVYAIDSGFSVWTPASVKKDLMEKGLSGGILIKGTMRTIDEAAPILAYEHNQAMLGSKTADKIDASHGPVLSEKEKKDNDNVKAIIGAVDTFLDSK